MQDNRLDDGILGIDAGGTFTDLAFISGTDSTVEAWAKTPTLHNNLLKTIESGLQLIYKQIDINRIKGVNLATTLATNAIVENKLRPCGLILIGYSDELVDKALKTNKFGTNNVLQINGGHDPNGNEVAPLDIDKLERNIDKILAEVESVAISGYFSVRNPKHELQVRDIIRAKSPSTYITCGHELASDLDAILRATTASLNAGLIPIVIDLFSSVKGTFKKYGVDVPISIVRSDGSLVGVEWANEHPIETILSGPAASSIGACHLAKAKGFKRPSWVVDIGGTTTDIIYLDQNGKPGLGTEGTTVGGRKTLIKSIDIYTFGLGGDSRVRLDNNEIIVGPRRVKSICSSASEINGINRALQHLININTIYDPLILLPNTECKAETSFEKRVIQTIDKKFTTPDMVITEKRFANMEYITMDEMESKGIILYSGFTPTDALHVLGKLNKWDVSASNLAAQLLCRGKISNIELSKRVCKEVVRKVALNVIKKGYLRINSKGNLKVDTIKDFESFINIGLLSREMQVGAPQMNFKLNAALIGVGAPAWAFIEEVGQLLGEKSYLPEHADVAGAVGAAVGTFSLRYSVLITPMRDGKFRAHMPDGIVDYIELKIAVDEAVKYMKPWIIARAKKSGAIDPIVKFKQEDEEAWIAGGLRKVHLWTQLLFNVEDAADLNK